jgi:transposase
VKNDDAIKNVFGIHPAKPKKANPKGKAPESNATKENV